MSFVATARISCGSTNTGTLWLYLWAQEAMVRELRLGSPMACDILDSPTRIHFLLPPTLQEGRQRPLAFPGPLPGSSHSEVLGEGDVCVLLRRLL